MQCRSIVPTVCCVLLIGAVAACGSGGSPGGASRPSQLPSTTGIGETPPTQLDQYVKECSQSLQAVTRADLKYAARVQVPEGRGQTYTAELDLAPSATTPTPGAPSMTQVPLNVECRAGARLLSEDAGIEVARVGDSQGWRYEQFTAVSSQLNWPWTITGTHLGTEHLRLEIRPAVITGSGEQVTSSTVISEVVKVDVTGSTIAHLKEGGTSAAKTFAILVGIPGIVLVALTLLLVRVRKFREAVLGLVRRESPADPAPSPRPRPRPRP